MVALDASTVDMADPGHRFRRYEPGDLMAASELLLRCGGRLRVRRAALVDTAILPGLVCLDGSAVRGLVTYVRHDSELELMVVAADPLDDTVRHGLLTAVRQRAVDGCRRVVATTSNADVAVQRSLQLAGFRICAIRAGAIEAVRTRLAEGRLPTEMHGVPIRDEIEFELALH